MKSGYDSKLIHNVWHTKFLGINIDSTLCWIIQNSLCLNWVLLTV